MNELLVDELNGSDIHRLENGLTLDQNKHSFFNTLKLWLEETVSVLLTKFGIHLQSL